ncbi:MAG: phytoene desaturase [Rhodobacteraceae bacterium]|nr:phytoene desaturase [Paracoccaceae bacterium]
MPVSPEAPRWIVIGGGIAGLATAARLRSAGFAVTLLERHAHLGGKIRTVPSPAGPIDAGPTVLTMRHVFDDLFACLGERIEDHVTLIKQNTVARHFWPDGSNLDLCADHTANIDAIRDFAGEKSAKQFAAFHTRTQALFSAFDAPMMQAAEPHLPTLVKTTLANPSLIPAMAPLSTLRRALRRSFDDPRLAQLFGRYATYVGGSPTHAPALLSLIWQSEAQGVWVVKGGMHKLATALAAQLQSHGVTIHTNAHVAGIATQTGRVTAVALADRRHLPCDGLVYAGDPRALATGALGPDVAHIAPQTVRADRSFSARVHSFAATPSGPELAHHNVFFDTDPVSEFNDLMAGRIPADPTLYLCALDRGQSPNVPQLERFEIISNAPATDGTDPPKDLDAWHQQIMARMARFGMSFSPTPGPNTVTTPQSFAQMFPASQGALYGQTPHGLTASLNRPRARTSIPNLYLAGGGTHPGAGVPMATLSARHAAEAILSDQTSMLRSAQMAMPGGMSTA